MGITQQQGFAALPYMILCGILCGVFYDGIRIIRVLFGVSSCKNSGDILLRFCLPLPHLRRSDRVQNAWTLSAVACIRKILIGFGDILSGVFFGCLFSIFLAHYALGVFRWFFLAASVLGFCFYYVTVGRAVMKCTAFIVGCIRVILCFILWLVLLPFRILARILRVIVVKVERHIICPMNRRRMFMQGVRYTEKRKRELAADMNLFYGRGE